MSWLIVKNALTVSAMVGTALLVINQYETLLGVGELRLIPAVLSFCVPIAVLKYGQFSNRSMVLVRTERGEY